MTGRTYADVVNRGSGSHVSPSLLLMPGDGDCMFHAIAHGVGGGRFDAQTLRFAVVGYERANRAEFEPFIEGDFERHLNAMAVPRVEWGDEPELRAAASVVGHRIIVWRDGRVYEQYGSPEDPQIHLRYSGTIGQGHYDLFVVPPMSAFPQPAPLPLETQVDEPVTRSVEIPREPVPRRGKHTKKGKTMRGRESKTFASHKEALDVVLGSVGAGEAVSAPIVRVATPGSVQNLTSALLTAAVEPAGVETSADADKSIEAPSTSFETVRRGRARGRGRRTPRFIPPRRVPSDDLDFGAAPAHWSPLMAAVSLEGEAVIPEPEEPADTASVSTERAKRGRGSCRGRHSADGTSVSTERDRRGRGRGRGHGRRARRRGRHSVTSADVDASAADEALSVTFMDCDDLVNDVHPTPPQAASDSEASASTQPNPDPAIPSRPPNPADFNRVSFLTRAMLEELEERSASDIVIESVQTDLVGATSDLNGPWAYKNSKKVIITYLTGEIGERRRILWQNLCRRGFCDPSRQGIPNFRFYSWLRFKEFAKKLRHSVADVLDSEYLFMKILGEVNRYYSVHQRCVEQEGLEPHRGPQQWPDAYNLLKLHYYGRGWYTYYRKATFKAAFSEMYGRECWPAFEADPQTDTVSEQHFEQLLKQVHEKIRKDHSRYTHLFEIFAGPQCHEDRAFGSRLNYDVKFTSHQARTTRGGRDCPPSAGSETQAADSSSDDVDREFPTFFIRRCCECSKLRVLDGRAAAKYPLGSYTYAGKQQMVKFTCDRLVETTCTTAADVAPCTRDKPSAWVALAVVQPGDRLPPAVIRLQTLRLLDAGDHTEENQVTGSYYNREDSQAAKWSDRGSLVTRTSPVGKVTIGVMSRRKRFQPMRDLAFTAARLTVTYPREAKCCQPWHDQAADGIDHENPSAKLNVCALHVLRDLHALYDSLRRVRCIICKRQTPGLPHPNWVIRVPEGGSTVELDQTGAVNKALADSEILHKCTVQLDPAFSGANGTVLTDRDAFGVCVTCSPSFVVDASNNIVPRPLVSATEQSMPEAPILHADVTNGAGDSQDSEELEGPRTHVCLYSAQNLMSTDIYGDENYYMFMKSLTRAEKMVIRPVHVAVAVLRSRANNVPFSKHGSICYPLKRHVQAVRLPWYDFSQLPFIVVAQRRRDGSHLEAMVNMDNIVRARHFMERRMPCKYNPERTRPYYRFVDEQWVPFSDENLQQLRDCLPDSSGRCLPRGVRVLHVDDVHARVDKVLHFQFVNWLESGFSMADTLRKSYAIEHVGEGADTTEANVRNLWEVIRCEVQTSRGHSA